MMIYQKASLTKTPQTHCIDKTRSVSVRKWHMYWVRRSLVSVDIRHFIFVSFLVCLFSTTSLFVCVGCRRFSLFISSLRFRVFHVYDNGSEYTCVFRISTTRHLGDGCDKALQTNSHHTEPNGTVSMCAKHSAQ